MNTKISRFLMLAVSAVIGLGAAVTVGAQDKALVLTVAADRETYVPGEAVRLNVTLANKSGASVKASRPDVAHGTLSIFLASGEGRFKRYDGPDWSTRADIAGPSARLTPGDSIEVETTVLYHRFRSASHLSELYARPLREFEIDDFFALKRPGQYRLKAVFHDHCGKTEIESAPLEISVLEPDGSDALFWEAIKDDRDAAWFLHTASVRESLDGPDRDRLTEKMLRLATLYPASVHAARFTISEKPVDP